MEDKHQSNDLIKTEDTILNSFSISERFCLEARDVMNPKVVTISPEYEDCTRLARETGESIVHIMNVARQVAES